jgi:transposase
MFELSSKYRYYLCKYDINMRMGIDGLCRYVQQHVPFSILSGDAFIFFNKARTMVKILKWDDDGFLLYQKKLQQGTFELPSYCDTTGCFELSWDTFYFIMRGVSLSGIKKRYRFNLKALKTS